MSLTQREQDQLVYDALRSAAKAEFSRLEHCHVRAQLLRQAWLATVGSSVAEARRIEEDLAIAWSSQQDAHQQYQEALRQLQAHVERSRKQRAR